MDTLWVPIALAAGLFQSARNGLARSISTEISPTLNTWSRFAFNLPFAFLLFTTLVINRGFPTSSLSYYLLCAGTGIAQLLGNLCLVKSFTRTTFAKSIVLHKLEIIFTTLIGAVFFAEIPSVLGLFGILISALGVVLMQRSKQANKASTSETTIDKRGPQLAVLAGLFIVFASFLLKEANLVLATLNPRIGTSRFEVAAHTLFHVTWIEVLILSTWLRLREPNEFSHVRLHWRRMALIGLFGFLGSLGWFWSYSLTLIAYVKAVGQVEALTAVLFSLFIWKEREVFRELPGILLVIVGIALVLIG